MCRCTFIIGDSNVMWLCNFKFTFLWSTGRPVIDTLVSWTSETLSRHQSADKDRYKGTAGLRTDCPWCQHNNTNFSYLSSINYWIATQFAVLSRQFNFTASRAPPQTLVNSCTVHIAPPILRLRNTHIAFTSLWTQIFYAMNNVGPTVAGRSQACSTTVTPTTNFVPSAGPILDLRNDMIVPYIRPSAMMPSSSTSGTMNLLRC